MDETFIYIGLIGWIFALFLAILYWISSSRTKKNHEILSRRNEQLRELSAFKEGLTNMIVHDMKNTLGSIVGMAQGKPTQSRMNTISRAGHSLINLVSNILDIQKFEESKVKLNLSDHSVLDLVLESRSETMLLLQSKDMTITIDVDESMVTLADKQLILRVLVNLITNAVKYSEVGSTIHISCKIMDDQRYLRLTVADNGQGIPKDQLPYIFDKFWQEKARKSGEIVSTGLGLTFCKLAIEAHEGNITVESQVDKGTYFHLTIPRGADLLSASDTTDDLTEELRVKVEKELDEILEQLDILRELKVFEIGRINRIINDMDDSGNWSVWKDKVIASVFAADQERYENLIGDMKTHVNKIKNAK